MAIVLNVWWRELFDVDLIVTDTIVMDDDAQVAQQQQKSGNSGTFCTVNV